MPPVFAVSASVADGLDDVVGLDLLAPLPSAMVRLTRRMRS
jgi:hypothetical protein